jgi:uncharacterized protein (DUF488 family)
MRRLVSSCIRVVAKTLAVETVWVVGPLMPTIFTIGHSTRTADEFVALLQQVAVDHLVDIRAIPRSRRNPQFNSRSLQKSLAAVGISYRHINALGGLRPSRADKAGQSLGFWQNKSFQDYADYAGTGVFHSGLIELREIALDHCCAVMCVEALWRRCHRRIITDYLLADGITVAHIMGLGKIDLASLTPGARLLPDGRLCYPAAIGNPHA